VPLEYTFEDFQREGTTSGRLWDKRQHDPGTDRAPEQPPE